MRKISGFSSASILVALLGVGSVVGFGCGSAEDDATEQSADEVSEAELAKIKACGLDDGTVEKHAKLHECTPGNPKKTTICHVPPGNPANAHTLCIGTPAVKHHLKNHSGDYLGPCKVEPPCPPPPPSGSGGASGSGGIGGIAGQGGSGAGGIGGIAGQGGSGSGGAGSGGASGTGGMTADGGTPGTGGSLQIVE